MVGEDLHKVPQHRSPAYFNHWLRPILRFFSQPRSQSTREKHNFHGPNLAIRAIGRPPTEQVLN